MGCSSSTQAGENSQKGGKHDIDIKNKIFNISENPNEFVFKNFSLSQDSYFDFLESIENHKSLEIFIMENIILNCI